MSVGFGFSVGDFIGALHLVGTVIDALRDSGGAGPEYRELVQELYTLESVLLRVKRLELDGSQTSEIIALRQAAAQCQRTIDDFLGKVQKYQPYLRTGESGSRIKDGWMKIRWALCKQEDVASFKASLRGHSSSIELLMTTIQMSNSTIQSRKQDQQHKSLAGMIQESSFQYMRKLATLTNLITDGLQKGRELLEITAQIVRTNIQIFQVVYTIQGIITQIPGQVNRQQPIYMIDALGKAMPFHLEFVQSAEALMAVLKLNLRKTRVGPEKIDRGEFLTQDWDLCFLPGQRVDMSMIFHWPKKPYRTCPSCNTLYPPSDDKDMDCNTCGMTFRSITETHLDDSLDNPEPEDKLLQHSFPENSAPEPGPLPSSDTRVIPHDCDKCTARNTSLFRRVGLSGISFMAATLLTQDCEGHFHHTWRPLGEGVCTIRKVKGEYYLLFVGESLSSISADGDIMNRIIRRQQDRVISWVASSEVTYALGFQDKDTCTAFWQYVKEALGGLRRRDRDQEIRERVVERSGEELRALTDVGTEQNFPGMAVQMTLLRL